VAGLFPIAVHFVAFSYFDEKVFDPRARGTSGMDAMFLSSAAANLELRAISKC
jgi:hypothetical protein